MNNLPIHFSSGLDRLFRPFVGIALVLIISQLLCSAQEDTAKPDTVTIDAETGRVIDEALTYLASNQSTSGAWIGIGEEERKYPIAMTSYSLMAFLAAGNLPGEGKHGAVVTRGVDYLISQVSDEGLFPSRNSGQYMYEHGIAAIVLAEVYGQSRDAKLKDRLQRVVRIIVSSQNNEGGWRYRPVVGEADISVTALQMVALRAAKNNGIAVPSQTIAAAVGYVRKCHVPSAGGFSYQPGAEPGFARTAAAIYSLQVCGEFDDPRIAKGSDYLFANVKTRGEWFTYGCFYAAPAQYMIGGPTWQRWYAKMKDMLLPAARRGDGGAYWDRSIDGSSPGPIYSTAVYAMILAMPNHYLPLYQR